MSRTPRQQRSLKSGQLILERLEVRQLLSGYSGVVATVPADGASLTQSPSSLIVTFNQALDPGGWWGTEVQLERLSADGTTPPAFDPMAEPSATLDQTGTQATILLDQPLTPGHYRVVLTSGSVLSLWGSG